MDDRDTEADRTEEGKAEAGDPKVWAGVREGRPGWPGWELKERLEEGEVHQGGEKYCVWGTLPCRALAHQPEKCS